MPRGRRANGETRLVRLVFFFWKKANPAKIELTLANTVM
jgi:hypothetical protein